VRILAARRPDGGPLKIRFWSGRSNPDHAERAAPTPGMPLSVRRRVDPGRINAGWR